MLHRFKTIGVLVLLAFLMSLTACSYSTDFVIVNDSTQVLKIEYRIKESRGEFAPPETPSLLPASKLGSHETQDWTRLKFGQYTLDPHQRTVSVSIMPGQALLVCRMHNYGGHDDARDAKEFPIDQIKLEGASGALLLNA